MITMLIVSSHSQALKWDNMEVSCSYEVAKKLNEKKNKITLFLNLLLQI